MRSVLANLFDACGEPKYLPSNNDPEFVAHSLTVWLAMAGTQSRFIKPRSSWQNGFFDRFNGELRVEFLHSEVFHNLADGQLKVRLFSRFCNVHHPQLVPGICPTRSVQRELSSESNEGGTLLFKNVPQKGGRSVRESIAKYTAGPDILFLEWKYRGNWSKEYPVLRYGDNVPERWQVSSLSHGLREKHTAKLV